MDLVGGHLNEDVLAEVLQTTLGQLPQGSALKSDVKPIMLAQGRRIFFIDKPNRSQTQIMVGHSLRPSLASRVLRAPSHDICLWGQFSSRLMQELRVKRGLSYGAYAWVSNHRFGGDYILNASVDSARLIEALQVLLEQFECASDGRLTDDELTFAQKHLLNLIPSRWKQRLFRHHIERGR